MKREFKTMLKDNNAGITFITTEDNELVLTIFPNDKYISTFWGVLNAPKFEEIEEEIKMYLLKEADELIAVLKKYNFSEITVEENSDVIIWQI